MDNPPVYAVRLRRRRRIPPLRKGVYLLPNLLTSAGLLSGFYSIICTLNAAQRARGGAATGEWPAGGGSSAGRPRRPAPRRPRPRPPAHSPPAHPPPPAPP